uniref:Sine oculis-binding protein homolog n=1 Tax=Clastoptera arizonana TaxID=38151 RepID=A0A1B6CKD9_9HEMI
MGSRSTSAANVPSRLIVNIKKEEKCDEEIKEYAETAMNELLGWYGYEKVDRKDTQALNLHHFATPGSSANPGSPASPGPASDTSSDAEGGARSSSSPGRHDASSPGTPPPPINIPPGCMACAWCQKIGQSKTFAFKTTTPNGQKAFCSEVCFTQCRRASFKRNKTCDWCRHIRHTVNYVDFQDGDHQLQFCSDKCLNQYKMNIFCKETQAHLQLHPHLKNSSLSNGAVGTSSNNASTLITPELWMRDCRSESPDSNRSGSPARIPSPIIEITTPVKDSPASTPPPTIPPQQPLIIPKCEPLPPPTKVKKEPGSKTRRTSRSKRLGRPAMSTSSHVEFRATSSSSPRSTNSVSPPKTVPPMMPPLPHYPPLPPHLFPADHPLHRPPFLPPGLFPPPHFFADLNTRFPLPRPQLRRPANPVVPPLLPINRPMQHPPMLQPPTPVPSQSLLPPTTVLIPYPIIIPVPIPIPIPIPLSLFKTKEEKSHNATEENEKSEETQLVVSSPIQSPAPVTSAVPLQPPRKRKRPEVPEEEPVRKQKSVPA